MPLAVFDLDHTLLNGDSDFAWGQFLIERGVVDRRTYEGANAAFYAAYKAGTLDIYAFLRFALQPLAAHERAQLNAWHAEFMQEKIRPMIAPAARELIEWHRRRGDTLLIITATNRFITEPIARELGIEHLLATDPAEENGRFTGDVSGTPCFQEGKVTRLREWLKATGHTLAGSSFYSDSHNDLPLLRLVSEPVAVNPDPILEAEARRLGWRILDLRGDSIREENAEEMRARHEDRHR